MLAWIQRFVSTCKLSGNHRELNELRVYEITEAEIKIIKTIQQNKFAEEYKCLALGKKLSKSSKILPFNPRIDENGLIRSGGRLKNADYLSSNAKYPIILPRGKWITELIVNYYHEKRSSRGKIQTLAKISHRIWILRGRVVEVRECENNCCGYKRRKTKISNQIMAPFLLLGPKQTLTAFSKVSVDYGGPFVTIQIYIQYVPFYMFIVTCCALRFDLLSRHGFFFQCILQCI